jgi:hypothetical protein
MDRERTFDDLTAEQQAQFAALLAEIDRHATSEAIVAAAVALGRDMTDEQRVELGDRAMAGGWAFDRVMAYLGKLRELNEERVNIGKLIYDQLQHPEPTSEDEVPAKAQAIIMAAHNSGVQEVIFNLFCICVQHIRSFLKIVAESVGYTIPPNDLDFLDTYRHLRNHYEHMYNRLPGKVNEAALITKDTSGGSYHAKGGLNIDSAGNILVVEFKGGIATTHAVAVTNAGMERINDIVEETWRNIKPTAIKNVRNYFIADPSNIPPPEFVTQDILLRAGGDRSQES